jgi:2,4'-dihydroxyacetophenone dioxygenase
VRCARLRATNHLRAFICRSEADSLPPIGGAFRYKENNWVARAGDTLYEVAGSSHTPESFEDTEIFFYMVGELLFLDQDNKILWQENHKTSIDRYTHYCADNGIPARDLTRWDA